MTRLLVGRALARVSLALLPALAWGSVGMTELPATAERGPIVVFYPSGAEEQRVFRTLPGGELAFKAAVDGGFVQGNGRLVIVSHGTGGAPWVHADLARALVGAGFVVALPEHQADNYKDASNTGPDSFATRPAEISQTIDTIGLDRRFAPALKLNRVGLYGMSAGGHTALTMAGGRWSRAAFKQHCEAHLAEDFQACVGLYLRLDGGIVDGFKKWLALAIIRYRFGDATPQTHGDPRVAAIVAAVPAAADFDMNSLVAPQMPLGLVTARQDRWLLPRFHGDRVLQVCKSCEWVADLPTGGHGALLSPLPPGLRGLIGDMLNDPPGFDRSELPAVDQKIAAFFTRHLLP